MAKRETAPWWALGVPVALAAAVLALTRRFERVEVRGVSMAPTLLPGDRLLVLRTRRLRQGDLAVVPDPREPTRGLVKRVAAVWDGAVVVRGDNADASTDSRAFGPVPAEALRGRAIYRYAPSDRSGRVGERAEHAGERPVP